LRIKSLYKAIKLFVTMKIISLKSLIAISVLAIVAIIVIVSCKKESTDCTAVITVKMLNDTMQIVSGANVIIAPDYPDVRAEGKSDANGQFTYVFKYEGILDVYAYKNPPDSVFGKTVVRLKPGEKSYKTVFVK
jgi:hypothetical protein